MITHPAFPVEPWQVRETSLQLDVLAQSESLFALSNGHVGWRANLDEGEPHATLGAYLAGLHELRSLPYAEAGFGYPESGQQVVNVTDGKVIRLLVDDEPFDVRYGELHAHERVLDLRAGTLYREADWSSPAGRRIRVRSTRLVSFTHRAIAAIRYEVEAVGEAARVVIQSELVANEPGQPAGHDPRAPGGLEAPLEAEAHSRHGARVTLVHRTRRSRLRLGVAMDHQVDGADDRLLQEGESHDDLGRVTVTARLRPGEVLRVDKYVAHGWSSTRSLPAVRDQVEAALAAALRTGWDGLAAEQRDHLDGFWSRADVEVDGDAEIQQAVRFGLFHVLQAGVRTERRAIAAKGLTGPGYGGHAFWDSEAFVLPMLVHIAPDAAANALRWRHTTLPAAVERARQLGLRGATFPWRTIAGEECSGYWPAGTAAFHVNADVADAVLRYVEATGQEDFHREAGLELLVQTARLWCSLGHYDSRGGFHIDGVTGPDEYSAISDDNVYTNLMAARNLRGAAEVARRHPDHAAELGVGADEPDEWLRAAEAMAVPYDDRLGVHPQAAGFTRHARWDFEATPEDHYPLMLHYPYFELYRKQVVKQADLVMAIYHCPDAFTPEQTARDFEYYEQLTVRDSSLSACCQAIVAAEVGHLDLAYDYLAEAALIDLGDLERNTADGLHLAALAGAWTALVAGFGGMRRRDGRLGFAPRLPEGIDGLVFRLMERDRSLRVEIRPDATTYRLDSGDPLTLSHHGEPFDLAGEPVSHPNPPPSPRTRPRQPAGREPATRARISPGV